MTSDRPDRNRWLLSIRVRLKRPTMTAWKEKKAPKARFPRTPHQTPRHRSNGPRIQHAKSNLLNETRRDHANKATRKWRSCAQQAVSPRAKIYAPLDASFLQPGRTTATQNLPTNVCARVKLQRSHRKTHQKTPKNNTPHAISKLRDSVDGGRGFEASGLTWTMKPLKARRNGR